MCDRLFYTTSKNLLEELQDFKTLMGIVYLFNIHTFSDKNVMLLLKKCYARCNPPYSVYVAEVFVFEMLCKQMNPSIYSDTPKLISYPYILSLMYLKFGLRFSRR